VLVYFLSVVASFVVNIIVIIVHEFPCDTSLKQNFRAAVSTSAVDCLENIVEMTTVCGNEKDPTTKTAISLKRRRSCK